jgi:hypothetical protein
VHVPLDKIAFVKHVRQLLLAAPEHVLQVVSHILRVSRTSLIPQDSSLGGESSPPKNFNSKVALVCVLTE